MTGNSLKPLSNNEIIKNFVKKPDFLKLEDEKKLLNLINNNKLNEFYNFAATLIRNSRDVENLYIYLFDKMEKQGIKNGDIKNQVCWRIFNISRIGWLGPYDPNILNFCKNNATDKNLIDELNNAKSRDWFGEYLKIVKLEKEIQSNTKAIEKNVLEYLGSMSDLRSKEKITEEEFNTIREELINESSIYKGNQKIGSLISEELQKRLGATSIAPQVEIKNKRPNHFLFEK